MIRVIIILIITNLCQFAKAQENGISKILEKHHCTYCHQSTGTKVDYGFASFKKFKELPFKKNKSCFFCHVNNIEVKAQKKKPHWLPLNTKSIPEDHGYNNVTSLDFIQRFDGEVIHKYTNCGFKQYLKTPLKRNPFNNGYMFPIGEERVDSIVSELNPYLEKCQPNISNNSTIYGKKLYKENCSICHDNNQAPKIKLEFPLISKRYFAEIVRNGTGGVYSHRKAWSRNKDTLELKPNTKIPNMPAFSNFTTEDVENLYFYLFLSEQDSQTKAPLDLNTKKMEIDLSNAALYNTVVKNVFQSSCKHCHSPNTEERAEIAKVFRGNEPQLTKIPVFPLAKHPVKPNPLLSSVLSPGKDCKPAKIVQALQNRANEISGNTFSSEIGGMPLTYKNVSEENIQFIKEWTQRGCPNKEGENLCDKC